MPLLERRPEEIAVIFLTESAQVNLKSDNA